MDSTRKFGVEIECFGATSTAIVEAIRALGIACESASYGHSVPVSWKVTTDGSLTNNNRSSENCWEVVSPPLSGDIGLEEIIKVANALTKAGCKVNRTCGLHVHVDTNDFRTIDLANLLKRYIKHEDTISACIPSFRTQNNFCSSVTALASYINADTITQTRQRFIERVYNGARYYTLNFLSWIRQGTVEFRQHSGTVNGTKIANWIQFCVSFVDASVVPGTYIAPANCCPQPTSAVSIFSTSYPLRRGYLLRSERLVVRALNNTTDGLTVEQIANIAFIPLSVVPQFISRIRNKFAISITQLRKRSGRYQLVNCTLGDYGAAPPAPVPVLASIPLPLLNDDNWRRNMAPEVVSWFEERAYEFGIQIN